MAAGAPERVDIKLLEQAKKAMTSGVLTPKDMQALVAASDLPVGELMLELIEVARRFARPEVSGFEVGAVGLGKSGALYSGANFEFAGCPLNQTIHAEQAVVINAAAHGETALKVLAVSAAPCGHCRQLLSELPGADNLLVLLPDKMPTALSEYLPAAFGPADLAVRSRLLMPQKHELEWAAAPGPEAASAHAALDAAARSFAPYSDSPAGVGLTVRDGTTFAGAYLESAAFNPSIPPLQAALVALFFAGHGIEEIDTVTLVQLDDTAIDHGAAAQALLTQRAPGLSLQVVAARRG